MTFSVFLRNEGIIVATLDVKEGGSGSFRFECHINVKRGNLSMDVTPKEPRNRRSAVVVTGRSPLQSEVVITIKTRGRTFTSFYEEQATAMESALPWTSTNTNHPSISILFRTESKSLCEALVSSKPGTFSIQNSINFKLSSIFIQWISGHPAIPGNDLADKVAKEATTIATNTALPVF